MKVSTSINGETVSSDMADPKPRKRSPWMNRLHTAWAILRGRKGLYGFEYGDEFRSAIRKGGYLPGKRLTLRMRLRNLLHFWHVIRAPASGGWGTVDKLLEAQAKLLAEEPVRPEGWEMMDPVKLADEMAKRGQVQK